MAVYWGAHGVMVIIIENGYGDPNLNCLKIDLVLGKCIMWSCFRFNPAFTYYKFNSSVDLKN